MRNIRLTISYDGTNYSGWQRQKGSLEKGTIQGTIEEALERLLQEKVKLIGSGRTDSGVHATAQVANFKTKSSLSLREIRRGLNGLLDKDIRIKNIKGVPEKFNSRYAVCSKTYQYIISHQDSPFLEHYTCFCPTQLDLPAMRKAAKALLGKHDFSSFQAAGSRIKDSVRSIKKLSIRKKKAILGNLILIEIEADGFLYKMARNIIGTLLEVGQGKKVPRDIKKILDKKNRKFAGPTAPAKGLYLKEVKYRRLGAIS
ncbi:MAG: tRNA pseudouridine(38-40) synthase TruA [Candidatus Omnitrophica bacterium]|nr:tRNA pseudouridine(38-40) synthase TruA [Candidatus Omnitrophota bacterium]